MVAVYSDDANSRSSEGPQTKGKWVFVKAEKFSVSSKTQLQVIDKSILPIHRLSTLPVLNLPRHSTMNEAIKRCSSTTKLRGELH